MNTHLPVTIDYRKLEALEMEKLTSEVKLKEQVVALLHFFFTALRLNEWEHENLKERDLQFVNLMKVPLFCLHDEKKLRLPRSVIRLKISRQILNQWEAKQNKWDFVCVIFLTVWASRLVHRSVCSCCGWSG